MSLRCLLFLATLLLLTCNEQPFNIKFPSYFPQSNRLFFDSVRSETIQLGEKLFFDPRLSKNNKVSCATCHLPELAFTDGRKISRGFEGRFSKHNASTLLNVGFLKSFMFDKGSHNIEIQPIIPLLDTNEMNMTFIELEEKFENDLSYQRESLKTYGRKLDRRTITWALAAYMKSLVACQSKFDSFLETKDSMILSPSERKGMQLFFGKGNCNSCHRSPLFTDSEHYNLGMEDSKTGRPGVFSNTLIQEDWGRFKTPSLRNIEITGPYFHDGRINSLEEAISYHQAPERASRDFIPAKISLEEVKSIASFLRTLTDSRYRGRTN